MMRLVGIVFFICCAVAVITANGITDRLAAAQAQTAQEPDLISGVITTTISGTAQMPDGKMGIVTIFPGQHIVIRLEKK